MLRLIQAELPNQAEWCSCSQGKVRSTKEWDGSSSTRSQSSKRPWPSARMFSWATLASHCSVIIDPADEGRGLLGTTQYTQPALFALEWSLAELWRSRGVVPAMVLGHSVGEIAAACVAGVMSMEAGLKLTAERGRLMQALPVNEGVMVAVRCGEAAVSNAIQAQGLSCKVAVAAVNGPSSVVVAGSEEAVEAVLGELGAVGHRLRVSHAFHSPLMEPMVEAYRE